MERDSGMTAIDLLADWTEVSVAGQGVIPGKGGELLVTASATAMTVTVATGSAIFNSTFVVDAAVDFSIDTTAANNRIDSIVIDWDSVTKTCALAVVKGVEAANPTVPVLAANEFLLGHVYIHSGATGATVLSNEAVWDKREFVYNGYLSAQASPRNLVRNSEWWSWSDATMPPDGWVFGGAPVTFGFVTSGAQIYHREQSVFIQGAATMGYQQRIYVPSTGGNRTVTIRFTVLSGGAGAGFRLVVGGAGVLTRAAMPNAEVYEVIYKHTVSAGTEYFDLYLQPNAAGINVYFGQVLVSVGHFTGVYRPIHEIIYFDYTLDDSNYDGTTGYSTGTQTINVNSDWSNRIPHNVFGIIFVVGIRDSGSAAGSAYIEWQHPSATDVLGRLECSGIVNDEWVYDTVFMPNDLLAPTEFIDINIVATGATTLDLILRPIGIVT
jgi:hypothetical protein